ncbi:carboxyvinyl-carboxyphosphonate phosphorylmutase [Cupriavidus gilardii CR3]|uniref:Carboxyvinyl-carboxyphosphonate phosphorylmutase n=1 Tax=Cupriavidus gilardii TaxID=82541 RepID=A0A849B3S4_9BURK|nr:isocitrate lyase/phosphoenolpyruvate mutase family protein [Cupriavidus gilardii]ALD92823.1 carboxyvinyl-carboxyphosphonate phosphorylmutase [Cupriavidus gilardii CR3]KAB0597516.1 carboxyvinyl-carboxyphosphonate phosphorylmutase [Cupriavidus gilardii]MCT9014494.1 isocitrate lyase/phosphoenolpyruvate mutase family protein [Cupriavidus gilardii]MCT9054214.1 isocitrate lyase/phosphoenolpyruvate mutase family protein [Cupriavidus gilardii]NNH10131.1 carboxyvinyl-carboxyphosphonate phosphorylmut
MNRTIVEAGRSRSLKERLRSPEPVLAPGVYDALSALLAEQAGFEALYLSGGAVAYTLLGRSDVGLTTATETADVLARIADRVSLPIIVDGDTGYGNALNTQRTVRAFERAGAAMIQLEDQGFPKRCGHLAGKSLVSTAEMCGKLRAALDARHDAGTLILARTDAVAVEGLDAAIERAEAYLACGVDALFVEAVVSAEDMGRVCERFAARIPLLANMVEGGKTPIQSASELGRRGYRIVIYPGGTVRFASRQLQRYFAGLKAAGTTRAFAGEMNDFDALNALIGTPELLDTGRRYAGED